MWCLKKESSEFLRTVSGEFDPVSRMKMAFSLSFVIGTRNMGSWFGYFIKDCVITCHL